MLTLVEKFSLAILLVIFLGLAFYIVRRMSKIIARGRGQPDWGLAVKRLPGVFWEKWVLLQPTWKMRFWPDVWHVLLVWGFIYYLLVNWVDLIQVYAPIFQISDRAEDLYRLLADLASLSVLCGLSGLALRRWLMKPENMQVRDSVLIHPKARRGIERDSAIVMGLIVIHVGAHCLQEAAHFARHRLLSESVHTAGFSLDMWQPLSSALANIWLNIPGLKENIGVCEHIFFWLSLGAMLAFIPYFLYSKHVHLIITPLRFMLRPEEPYPGALAKIDLEDDTDSQLGAARLEDLDWQQIMDAYACVMCFRCQEVCPAYNTGTPLSPAALEINKRYFLNEQGAAFSRGAASTQALVEFALSPEAVWACTACGACEEVCPVGNQPMHDILEIRRSLTLLDDQYPSALRQVYRNLEHTFNPWGMAAAERMNWARGIPVPTIRENPHPKLLWWLGCAAAFDPQAQKSARAFAHILNAANVDYAVLGTEERCTGDMARRSGREDLFFQLAAANMALLDEVKAERIVTLCPHCLQTLQNDYQDFGGKYKVLHHTQLIVELIESGQLHLDASKQNLSNKIAYHDPCYLSRFNGVVQEPRQVLQQMGKKVVELPRHGTLSFCCGAGGGQLWKEEINDARINVARLFEAQQAGADTLTVGCPFCLSMLTDAAAHEKSMEVREISEWVAEQIKQG